MRASLITPATIFVDWNSQIHAARPNKNGGPVEICEATLRYVGRVIGKALNEVDPQRRYDVTLRVYHGWHKGFEPSARRKAMIKVISDTDFVSLSTRSNVAIRPTVYFGDLLMSALPRRLHERINVHIPNTLRQDTYDKDEIIEKMVDSAIAGEVVDLAHREPNRWLMVIGDDDDLVPPLFIAEGARRPEDGKVLLIRCRESTPFFKLEDMSMKP